MIELTPAADGTVFRVKVQAGAGGRTAVVGEWNGAVKMKVGKPPERGAANRECLEFLARRLGVPVRCVTLTAGAHASLKTIRVSGLARELVLARLQP